MAEMRHSQTHAIRHKIKKSWIKRKKEPSKSLRIDLKSIDQKIKRQLPHRPSSGANRRRKLVTD
ncbi:hypothetical protein YC2023_040842 [Brassica napus]